MQTQTAYVPPANAPELTERECILNLLGAFMRQRSGLDWRNYGDAASYRAEQRSITRDLHHARTLLTAVRWRSSITADHLRAAFRAFSGRLSYDPAKRRLDYCTGQYFPTEYRRAVCAVLAAALWDYARENMPDPDAGTPEHEPRRYGGLSAGDWLRRYFHREFGRAISKRWFD